MRVPLLRRCMLKLHGWCSRRRQSHTRRHGRLLLVLWHHCWLDRGLLLLHVTYLLLLHMWELLVLQLKCDGPRDWRLLDGWHRRRRCCCRHGRRSVPGHSWSHRSWRRLLISGRGQEDTRAGLVQHSHGNLSNIAQKYSFFPAKQFDLLTIFGLI